jgi:stage V sporulation protein AB
MIPFFRKIACVLIGFGSGLVISGAIFAFIAAVGLVPRVVQKTKTKSMIKYYETVMTFGGVLGGAAGFWDFRLPKVSAAAVLFSFGVGAFTGCLAASLAEVINVIPILSRRAKIERGLFFFILALALGKMCGALLYYRVGGFYKP